MLKKLLIIVTGVLFAVILLESGFYLGYSYKDSVVSQPVQKTGENTEASLPFQEMSVGEIASFYKERQSEKSGEFPVPSFLIPDFFDDTTLSLFHIATSSNSIVDSKLSYTLIGKITRIDLHAQTEKYPDAFILTLQEGKSALTVPVFSLRNAGDETTGRIRVDKIREDTNQLEPLTMKDLKAGDIVKIYLEMDIKLNRIATARILLLPSSFLQTL